MRGQFERPPVEVGLWPDFHDAFAIFLAMQTQWNWVGAGMAGAFQTGLRYEVIETVARGLGITYTTAIFADIRTCEAEALTIWSRRR